MFLRLGNFMVTPLSTYSVKILTASLVSSSHCLMATRKTSVSQGHSLYPEVVHLLFVTRAAWLME